jgi:hypothetical protein
MEFTDELKAFKKLASRDALERIRHLVQKKYGPALLAYGDMCMGGFWDITGMQTILAMEHQLAPKAPVENPRADPYLLVPRNPQEAIAWYLEAAKIPATSSEATFRLALCQLFGLAGLGPKNTVLENPQLAYHKTRFSISKKGDNYFNQLVLFLKENGKSDPAKPKNMDLERGNAKAFFPLPDKRPAVEHPLMEPFKRVADSATERDSIAIVITLLLTIGLAIDDSKYGFGMFDYLPGALVFWGILVAAPLLTFKSLVNTFGAQQRVPVCACKSLREAYRHRVALLPKGAPQRPDPFKVTSPLVRNLLYFKQCFNWALFVGPLVFLAAVPRHIWDSLSGGDEVILSKYCLGLAMCYVFIGILNFSEQKGSLSALGNVIIAPTVTENRICKAILKDCEPITAEEFQAIDRL